MKMEWWQSQEFEHAHEVRALDKLLADLRAEDWDDFCLVCSNFFCGGEQIDLMVIKRQAIVVIELKEALGRFEGGENGEWLLTDHGGNRVRLNPGRRNPYQQARAMRYAVADFLRSHSTEFMPVQKALQLDFMHVSSVVAFTEYNPDSTLDLPHAPWFSVAGMDRLVEELRVRRSTRLDFSRSEATALVRDVLRLRRVEIEPKPTEVRKSTPAATGEVQGTQAAVTPEVEIEEGPVPCIVCGEEHACAIPHLVGTLVSSSEGRPLRDLDLIVFDVETTGIDATAGDRVVEVAALRVSRGKAISEFRELIYSGVPVGDTVKVHGYTDEHLRSHGKPPEDVFPKFVDFIQHDILAAHNLSFDWSFVNSELALIGLRPLQNATLDTLSLARRILPQLTDHKLGTVSRYFKVALGDAHHALVDVRATWGILEKLAQIVEDAGLVIDPERTARLIPSNGRSHDIRMINQWADVPRQIEIIENSRVLGNENPDVVVALHHLLPDPGDPGRLLAGHDSLVVIEPDWLVEVGSLEAVGRCDREYLVRRFTPREPNEPMLVGSLAHSCFEAILRDPEDDSALGHAFHNGARDRALDLIALNSDEETIAPGVRSHAKILRNWAREMPFRGVRSPETFVFSPQLGLKGVIDALWKDENGHPSAVVELKTGTPSWYKEPWPGHALQAGAYALMLKAREPQRVIEPPIVLYTGRQAKESSGTEKRVSMSPELAARVVSARNRVLVADYCLETLDSGIFPCPRCFGKEGCAILSALADGWPQIEPAEESEIPEFGDEDRRFFEHYATLLAREYKAFKDQHRDLWTSDSKMREEDGTAVSVPRIGQPEAVEGGFLYNMPCNNRSELREGQFVVISDGSPGGTSRLVTGRVDDARRSGIAIRTGARLDFASALVDSYSGERLLESEFQSLYDWLVSKPPRVRRMVIDEDAMPRFGSGQEAPSSRARHGDSLLNKKQEEALGAALDMRDYLLIKGPPGSGKTVLIEALARALFERGDRILLSANTNQALDKAILALMNKGYGDRVVRLGREVGVTDERVRSRLLTRLAGFAERGAYVRVFRELLETMPVVAATVAGWRAFPRILGKNLFDVAIVDEATQITVPSALGVLRHVDKFVLLGDPNQLPPVVLHESRDAENTGAPDRESEASPLSLSLFEILLERVESAGELHGIVTLEEQYRMNETICRFPSNQWYGGRLRPAAKTVERGKLAILAQSPEGPLSEMLDPEKHLVIVDVPGSAEAGYMPRTNAEEARLVSEIVLAARRAAVPGEDIAVITPYRAQVALIRRELEGESDGLLSGDEIRRMVDTVDRFQGDERKMVIVSFATYGRTLSDHVKNQRRLNVALTRAQHKLVLIGDRQVLSQDDLFARLFSLGAEDDAHTLRMTWAPPHGEEFAAF